MTIQFIKPLDIEEVRAKVIERIASAERHHEFYLAMLDIVKRFEGKQITKRIANALQEKLPDYTIFYDADFSMYHIHIGGNGIEWGNRPSILLGYKASQKTVSTEFFIEHNQGAYLEKERAQRCIESLPHLAELVERWNQTLETLQEIHVDAAQWGSTIEYTFDLDIRR